MRVDEDIDPYGVLTSCVGAIQESPGLDRRGRRSPQSIPGDFSYAVGAGIARPFGQNKAVVPSVGRDDLVPPSVLRKSRRIFPGKTVDKSLFCL